jgi:hypothetical protein
MPGSVIVSSLPGIGRRRARVLEGPDLEQRDGQRRKVETAAREDVPEQAQTADRAASILACGVPELGTPS